MNPIRSAYRGENDADFPKMWRVTVVLSLVLVIVSLVSLATRGLELGIDFEGGSTWTVTSESFEREDAERVLQEFDAAEGAKYQEATSLEGVRSLRVSSQVDDIDRGAQIAEALATAADVDAAEVTVSTIGPSWGADITRQAALSLVWFILIVTAYLAWRLEPKMAIASIAGVLHDLIVTVGIYSIFAIEVTPATVIAFLTIMGYSLYDTVVVFDRTKDTVRRYAKSGRYTYTAIMRHALNQSLMRCINTTVTTILPVLSLLVVGGYLLDQPLLTDFSLALLIGLTLGAYSSLFLAAPIEVFFKEREAHFVEIRERLVSRGVDIKDTSWHGLPSAPGAQRPVASAAAGTPGATTTATAPPLSTNVGGHPPRPRKKRR